MRYVAFLAGDISTKRLVGYLLLALGQVIFVSNLLASPSLVARLTLNLYFSDGDFMINGKKMLEEDFSSVKIRRADSVVLLTTSNVFTAS